MSIRHIAPWGISVALLVAAAAFFLFSLKLAYASSIAAVAITMQHMDRQFAS